MAPPHGWGGGFSLLAAGLLWGGQHRGGLQVVKEIAIICRTCAIPPQQQKYDLSRVTQMPPPQQIEKAKESEGGLGERAARGRGKWGGSGVDVRT